MVSTTWVRYSALIVASGLLLVAIAQPAPAQAAASTSVLNLYLNAEGMTLAKPTGATSSSKTAVNDDPAGFNAPISPASSGGLAWDWGTFKFPAETTYSTGGVATLYLQADTATVVDDIFVGIYRGTATTATASGSRGVYANQSTSPAVNPNILSGGKVLKVEIPLLTLANTKWTKDEVMTLAIGVSSPTVEGTPTDLKILFGSDKHASRISGGVKALPAGAAVGDQLQTFYLADKSLTTVAPTATTALKRVTESVEPNSKVATASIASSSTWSWGKTTLTSPLKASGDALFTVFIGLGDAQAAAAFRGVKGIVVFTPPGKPGLPNRQGDVGIRVITMNSAQTLTPPTKLGFGVNMTGIDVPAGTTMEVFFVTWTTSDTPGKVYFHYGSKDQPAAVQFIATGSAGGGGATTTSTSSSAASSSGSSSSGSPSPTVSSSASPSSSSNSSQGSSDAAGQGAGAKENSKDVVPPGAAVPGAGLLAAIAALACALVALRPRR